MFQVSSIGLYFVLGICGDVQGYSGVYPKSGAQVCCRGGSRSDMSDMSHSPTSLKGGISGIIRAISIGVIERHTRSLDYGSAGDLWRAFEFRVPFWGGSCNDKDDGTLRVFEGNPVSRNSRLAIPFQRDCCRA